MTARRWAYVLLGVMTLVSFGGPFLIAVLLWGGERSGWPPDRTIEWIGVGFVFVLFLSCFVACLSVGTWLPKSVDANRARSTEVDSKTT